MSRMLALVLLATPRIGNASERTLREISWSALRDQGALAEGLEVQSDGSLSVTSPGSAGLAVTLAEISNPGITSTHYVVRGRVRYQGVAGNGFLEMWNVFADGGRYFTRTTLNAGPLQKITGSSEWRDFGLYFDATDAKAPVEKLIIGLVLPGPGEVSLSKMALVELPGGMPQKDSGWWGAIAGGALGVIGALLGSLAGAGRARTFVLAGLKTMMAAGVIGLALGIFALSRSAPYQTYYPLFLLSSIALAVPGFTLPGVRKRYEELELRRMWALDA